MSAIFHRSLDKAYPEAVSGEGVFLVTRTGERILDGSSGAAVSCLGHNNREVVEAIVAQTRSLSFAHTHFFTSDPAEQLARLLIAESPPGAFSRAMFLCSGSEAVESALKMARQFHVYNGEPRRVNFIGRFDSYHGNTLGALAAGNNPARRAAFAPILSPVFHHVSRCFYDADGGGRTEQEYEDGLIAELEAKVDELGPATVAAVMVEPVVGATLGAAAATKTYLPRLRRLCDAHGILLIFDEVMCGMGRSGTYHAWEQLGGARPDLQTVGKGLGAGYQPLSAVLVGQRVLDVFEEQGSAAAAAGSGAGKFTSGHTFQGHAVACAGALAVQRILKRDALLGNVARMGALLASLLEAGLPAEVVGQGASVRGLGLFRGVDFGRAGALLGGPLAAEVGEESFRRGAAVYPCSTEVDAVLLAPPFIISADEVKLLADTLLAALGSVLARRRAARDSA